MQHYPKMTTEYPAKSEEFRRVLWTGESSQLVEMTIPVGGDIGEEASSEHGSDLEPQLFIVCTYSSPAGSPRRPALGFHSRSMQGHRLRRGEGGQRR